MAKTRKQSARSTNFARFCGGDVLQVEDDKFTGFIEAGVEYALRCDGLPTISIELTAWQAERLLERNGKNRSFSATNASGLKVDMVMGAWKLSADPIVISSNGELLSGQHRLAAHVEYGKPLEYQLTFGMTFGDSVTSLDRGRSRSPAQVVAYTTGLKGAVAAIIRAAWFAPVVHERKLTSTEQQELAGVYGEKANKALVWLNGCDKSCRSAPVVACIVRAMDHIDHVTLERFCLLYAQGPNGVTKANYEKVVLVLREAILKEDKGSAEARKVKYLKTQAAVKAFADKRKVCMLRATKGDAFPLTGDAERVKAKWDKLHANNTISSRVCQMVREPGKVK